MVCNVNSVRSVVSTTIKPQMCFYVANRGISLSEFLRPRIFLESRKIIIHKLTFIYNEGNSCAIIIVYAHNGAIFVRRVSGRKRSRIKLSESVRSIVHE